MKKYIFLKKKKRRVRIYGRFSLCQLNPIKPELYQARESLVGGGGGGGVIFAHGKQILITPFQFIARTRKLSHHKSWTLTTNVIKNNINMTS